MRPKTRGVAPGCHIAPLMSFMRAKRPVIQSDVLRRRSPRREWVQITRRRRGLRRNQWHPLAGHAHGVLACVHIALSIWPRAGETRRVCARRCHRWNASADGDIRVARCAPWVRMPNGSRKPVLETGRPDVFRFISNYCQSPRTRTIRQRKTILQSE
jgi:hypothetical protein